MKNVILHLEYMIAKNLDIEHLKAFKQALKLLKATDAIITEMDKPNDAHRIECSICVAEIRSHKDMQVHVTVTSDKYEFLDVWNEPG